LDVTLISITHQEKIYIFNKILNIIDKRLGLSGSREALIVSTTFDESFREFSKIQIKRKKKKKRIKSQKKSDNRFENIVD
jgi:hypothetical protein